MNTLRERERERERERVYVCVYVRTYVCMYVYVRTYVCMYVCNVCMLCIMCVIMYTPVKIPAVTCNTKLWTLTNKMGTDLMARESKMLRKIYEAASSNDLWGARTSQEIYNKLKSPDIVNVMEIR